MSDFTLEKYTQILQAISDTELKVYGIRKWMAEEPPEGVIIRHDVDRKPLNSLRMAEVEAKMGIKTTYYFRIYSCSLDEKILKAIKGMGHEIGYHYEDLAACKGQYEVAKIKFREHLELLREMAPIETVAMHGRPLSKVNNLDFWNKYSLSDFDLKGEAFLNIDYSDIFYFTDTGRTLGETSANLRDHTDSLTAPQVSTSDDLIEFICRSGSRKLALVIHPERWSINPVDWTTQYSKDMLINVVKRGLRTLRN